jgi:hypothetical protein
MKTDLSLRMLFLNLEVGKPGMISACASFSLRNWYRMSAVLMAVLLLCCATADIAWPAPGSEASGRPVEVQMRNVMYHFTNSVAVHIRKLHGQLAPRGDIPVFDDKESFTLQIDSAEIAMTPDSLANVLNSYVFARRDAPLKHISIRIENGRKLMLKGKLHSKGDIPFETEGQLSATSDGGIRLHTEKIKVLHVPIKGLMDLLGIEIAELVKAGKVRGVQAEKDDLLLDPHSLLPPPHIAGEVSEVRLERDNIVQIFGASDQQMPMRVHAPNYMAYRGNQLRFGKLTMSDTDMVLIDMDPKDPFDFYLDHYKEQLVAGYTKETPSFGLRVFMRDYNKLERGESIKASNPKDIR